MKFLYDKIQYFIANHRPKFKTTVQFTNLNLKGVHCI